ncbi:hypothetical protein NQZ68_027455 [Dissostichus eleginoides]|nr:hypothetical protein NQZ68_027455 [Dissostichus eleginoides]
MTNSTPEQRSQNNRAAETLPNPPTPAYCPTSHASGIPLFLINKQCEECKAEQLLTHKLSVPGDAAEETLSTYFL